MYLRILDRVLSTLRLGSLMIKSKCLLRNRCSVSVNPKCSLGSWWRHGANRTISVAKMDSSPSSPFSILLLGAVRPGSLRCQLHRHVARSHVALRTGFHLPWHPVMNTGLEPWLHWCGHRRRRACFQTCALCRFSHLV
jgi:hypothetical protein